MGEWLVPALAVTAGLIIAGLVVVAIVIAVAVIGGRELEKAMAGIEDGDER